MEQMAFLGVPLADRSSVVGEQLSEVMAKLLGVGLSSAAEEDLRQANHMPQSVPSDEQLPSVASFQVNSDAPEQDEHPPLTERFEQAPPAPENPTPVEAMAHRLKTPEGRKVYALRKQTVNSHPISTPVARPISATSGVLELIPVVHRRAALRRMGIGVAKILRKRQFRSQRRRHLPDVLEFRRVLRSRIWRRCLR